MSDYLPLLDGQKETSYGIQCLCAFSLHLGKKTTIIIDCFEVFIERPSNLLARSQTFSNDKYTTIRLKCSLESHHKDQFVLPRKHGEEEHLIKT